ncbi:MAG: DUF2911 domain-containing protein [Saprospiraceae bacterium]|nr:DUF2911 domain-containing protein [Saprospiraceae bacterium]
MLSVRNILRISLMVVLGMAFTLGIQAQDQKRKSPPIETKAMVGDASITINYSAPYVKGRTIFGDLEEWGELWRTGANEATVFEVSKDISVEGTTLPAGKYALFSIPNPDKWTIILNSVFDQWGHYDYDQGKDVLRVDVTPSNTDTVTEQMNIAVEEMDGKQYVVIAWDHTKVPFEVGPATTN